MVNRLLRNLQDVWQVFAAEARRVFSDKTTIVIFFLATVIYPPLYYYIYHLEVLQSMPVAVVDLSQSEDSKRFVRKLEATPELRVAYRPANLGDAQQLLRRHEVKAIYLIPRDYSTLLAQGATAHVACYSDISSFLYYKNSLLGGSHVLIDEMDALGMAHAAAEGETGKKAEAQVQPVVLDDIALFNPTGGYASYFIPALLVLVVHQTLFFGICVLCGDACENRRALRLIPPHLRGRSIYRVILGRMLCFLFIYIPISLLDLCIVPRLFGLPQLGSLATTTLFILPLILATSGLAMTLGNLFARQRMDMLLCCLFFSVVLFFLSGVVWPRCSMPRFWQVFALLFPSTPGVQGMVRIGSMGAGLAEVHDELATLWIQAACYFATACLSLQFVKKYRK